MRHRRFLGRAQQDAQVNLSRQIFPIYHTSFFHADYLYHFDHQEVLRNILGTVCSEEVTRLRRCAEKPPPRPPAAKGGVKGKGGVEGGVEDPMGRDGELRRANATDAEQGQGEAADSDAGEEGAASISGDHTSSEDDEAPPLQVFTHTHIGLPLPTPQPMPCPLPLASPCPYPLPQTL